MKDSNKSREIAGQSDVTPKSRKHDANLQKNSSLYFQIGLILCLLATYAIFEMQFENKLNDEDVVFVDPDDTFYVSPNFVVEPDAPKTIEVKKQKRVLIDKDPVIVDDDTNIDDTPILVTAPVITSAPINPETFIEPKDPSKDEVVAPPFNMNNVEIVPIYPGCEKMTNNASRIKCMSEKIGKLVQRKFDAGLASELGLYGKQRIDVRFKIDPTGNITEIMTRAPHPSLEKEAERVTNKIPQMQPGLQRKKPVSVVYNLPIIFNVNQ
ncbi:MAG: energy transducer TonB [Psychroserpens sp.]|uniref:energy transducer TonB n=1 Tax=Psychroserpens sp. TaxID=2020870 RepID=UPI003C723135